jgi:hypothetical protein
MLHGCLCWLVALGLTGGLCFLAYYVATRGGALALQRDKENHLRVLNDARIRSGKRPLTMEEFVAGVERGPTDVPMARVVTGGPAAPASVPNDADAVADELGRVRLDDPEPAVDTAVATAPEAPPVASLAEGEDLGRRLAIVLVNRAVLTWTESEIRKRLESAWGVEIPVSRYAAEWVRQDAPGGATTVISCGGFLFRVESLRLPRGYHVEPGPTVSIEASEVSAEARAVTRIIFLSDMTDGVEKEMVYGLLGKLAAELADTATVAVHIPQEGLLIVYDPRWTDRALRSEDVIKVLRGD